MNQESISTLKGIGDKTAALFSKLSIETISDLLNYYPKAYQVYEEPLSPGGVKEDTLVSVCGSLSQPPEIIRVNRLNIVTAVISDKDGRLSLTWFNMPFLKSTLKTGEKFIFRGKVVKKKGHLCMEQPEIFNMAAYQKILGSMQPVYGQTKGLGNKTIVKAVKQALEERQLVRDYLPPAIRVRHQLAEYNFSIEHIHFPKDEQEFLFSRKRLVFDEFFIFILAVRHLKDKRIDNKSAYRMEMSEKVHEIEKKLPYSLTAAQSKVLSEVYSDMTGGLVMNRLIQGDVGSGKTIIAVLALLLTAYNGMQGALMVPTEVLARQHYEAVTSMLLEYGVDKKAVLVTGSMTAKEKREAYKKIEDHEADIIIGTHALIQEKVNYSRLALVITDEQHRFGVGQREHLESKGNRPHVMVMSATPIPRTLAIIIYGDLDISVINELPANRLPVKNCVVNKGCRKKAYDFIAKEAASGRQAYVICPMVEESEMIEAENVLDYSKKLQKELPDTVKVGFLHGKMKPKEKKSVMESFASNEIQVLVSTTVIEVGVNVPNATVMMIENAERFGLAQLHQLRGRVGRGKYQSYCIMVNTSSKNEAGDRLDILNKSNDGFYIASEDLKLRGPGDIFGIRQSGDMEFKLGDIFTDADILKTVSDEVNALLEDDAELKKNENSELKRYLDLYLEKSYEKINL